MWSLLFFPPSRFVWNWNRLNFLMYKDDVMGYGLLSYDTL